MGYSLQALIGKQQTLAQHTSDFQHARMVALAQGIAMIPIINDLFDEIGDGGQVGRFYKLSTGIEKWAQRISVTTPVTYVEADFFGGIGDQNAMAWSGGMRVLGPIYTQDAINQALRFLGVQRGDAFDEFDAIGLGRHRATNDWIEQES